jgi:hypothetical protein
MANCPSCKKEIDHLSCHMTEETEGHYWPGSGFDEKDRVSCESSHWSCPECGVELDISYEEEAKEFLDGKFPVLTKEQQKWYLENSSHCPVCKGDDIDAGSMDFDTGSIIQEVSCKCGARWHDVYTLTDVHARE